jgi:hypothetical protein
MGPLIQLNNYSCAKEVVFAQALDHEWMPFRLQSPTHCQDMCDGTQFNRQDQCLIETCSQNHGYGTYLFRNSFDEVLL